MKVRSLVNLLRVRQWIKNSFLVFPLIFSGHFLEVKLWDYCLWGIASFCLISSGMYIINDILDLKEDRLLPEKSRRPLAAGEITVAAAGIISAIVLASGIFLSWMLSWEFFVLALAYILLHILYNLRTKHVVIVDALTLAFGFQLRIWAGSAAVHILPSLWLQMCVLVLALFLGFTKRRYEISLLKVEAANHRGVLSHYTSYLLDQMILICATLSIVFYGLYTISTELVQRIGGYEMFYSTVFVIYGIFRYLYLVHVRRRGGDPGEVLLSDPPLMINVLLWVIFVMSIILFSKM
ncbi:MAG: decaprenyl-phosphate phosphoribosyltransferase [Candidatus Omnitrophica bacterium]|nr:decaprenyl-phosphate phosphoribosyltransferase [Candidatus Omnitrophota bacterium]